MNVILRQIEASADSNQTTQRMTNSNQGKLRSPSISPVDRLHKRNAASGEQQARAPQNKSVVIKSNQKKKSLQGRAQTRFKLLGFNSKQQCPQLNRNVFEYQDYLKRYNSREYEQKLLQKIEIEKQPQRKIVIQTTINFDEQAANIQKQQPQDDTLNTITLQSKFEDEQIRTKQMDKQMAQQQSYTQSPKYILSPDNNCNMHSARNTNNLNMSLNQQGHSNLGNNRNYDQSNYGGVIKIQANDPSQLGGNDRNRDSQETLRRRPQCTNKQLMKLTPRQPKRFLFDQSNKKNKNKDLLHVKIPNENIQQKLSARDTSKAQNIFVNYSRNAELCMKINRTAPK